MKPLRRQGGATLIVALIFLVLMSLFAVNAFLGSNSSLRVVGNMQARQEATDAAQVAIEQTISSNAFKDAPPPAVAVDLDRDAKTDYTVQVAVRCFRTRPVKNSEIDPLGADKVCVRSSGAGGPLNPNGVVMADNSLCHDSEWDVAATSTDARTQVAVTVHQGVGIRMTEADAINSCK